MTTPDFDPPHREMGRHITAGLLSSGFSQTVKVAGQFISVVVLSRLLAPSDFGIVAMVGPVMAFAGIILDLGFSQATVQKSTFGHEEANTLFWINVSVGAVLTVAFIALSPAVGWYYKEPRTVALTAATAFLLLVGALGNQHTAILTRRMQFGALAIVGMISTLVALVVSIGYALLFHSYWALFFGPAASTFAAVAGVWIASGWRPSAPHLAANTRALLHFGAGITGSNIANYFSTNMDNILIGHAWGDQQLGLYDRAYKLLLFPLQKIVGPVTSTLVPVLSRLVDNPDHYRAIFFKALGQTTLLTWPGILWSVIFADTLVPVLLGKQWAGTAPIFQLLALVGFLQVVGYFSYSLMISQGRSSEIAFWSVVNAVTSVSSFLIGLPYGPIGVAGAYGAVNCIMTPVFWYFFSKRGPVHALDILRAVLPQIIGLAAAGLVLLAFRAWVDLPPFALLAASLVLAYAITAMTMTLSPSGRAALLQSLNAAKKILGHIKIRA